MSEHNKIQLYVGLEEGGCVDVGAIKLAGFTLIETNALQDLKAERDALAAQVKELKSELRQEKLIHIGFTNESQVQYVTEDKEEGAFYPNSDHGCYIPVYMLNVHAHRVGSESKIYCTQLEQGKKIAEIRAEAVKEFIEFMYKSKDCQLCSESLDKASQYADSILAGKE